MFVFLLFLFEYVLAWLGRWLLFEWVQLALTWDQMSAAQPWIPCWSRWRQIEMVYVYIHFIFHVVRENTCLKCMPIAEAFWILITWRLTILSAVQCRLVLILHYAMFISIGVYLSCTLTLFVTSHHSQEAGCLSWLKRTPAQYFIQTLLASMLATHLFFKFVFWVAQVIKNFPG